MAENSNSDSGVIVESKTKVKHDWYQTESQIIITILAKNVKQDQLKVEFGEETVSIITIFKCSWLLGISTNFLYPMWVSTF